MKKRVKQILSAILVAIMLVGTATITCTVTDSNGNTVQDTCKVTVKYSFGQWLIVILLFGWIWH